MRKLLAALSIALNCFLPCAAESAQSSAIEEYQTAQQNFEALNLQDRILLQVLLTATGYWNAVPNEDFSRRLFEAITKFQIQNGYVPNGIIDGEQRNKLNNLGDTLLKEWGFKTVAEPFSGRSIWIPLGLGLAAATDQYGIQYSDPNQRISIVFNTIPNATVASVFAGSVSMLSSQGSTIHYKLVTANWYVISSSTTDGVNHYARYHQNGQNVTGFAISWDNSRGDTHGERIAVLMSGSLYSAMTGTPFIDPIVVDETSAETGEAVAPLQSPIGSGAQRQDSPELPPTVPRETSQVASLPASVTPAQLPVSDQGSAPPTGGSPVLLLVLAVPIGLIILISILRRRDRKIRTERVLRAAYATINQHKRALMRRRFQTVRHDDYGNIIIEQWKKELLYFIEKVLDPAIMHIGTKEYVLYQNMRPALLLTIDNQIAEQAGSSESFTLGPNLTPTDYEQYCAQELRAAGWSADTTKTSGDQGTDIVAQKGDLGLVVQCKLYSHPVGNKAVQEVAAARAHEQADCAAVVSNSPYTYSAQQLAATNGVLLLHHSDLRNIDDLLSA